MREQGKNKSLQRTLFEPYSLLEFDFPSAQIASTNPDICLAITVDCTHIAQAEQDQSIVTSGRRSRKWARVFERIRVKSRWKLGLI